MQEKQQNITKAGGKALILQGSCLNYNLERYSCFVENVNIVGSLVDSSLVVETRQGCLCVCTYACATNNCPSVLGCVTCVSYMCMRLCICLIITNSCPGRNVETIVLEKRQLTALFGQNQSFLAMPRIVSARY